MIGFEIYVNGERLGTVGIGDHGVISANLSWACRRDENTESGRPGDRENELNLSVGGLYSDTREHVEWPTPDLRVDDELRIKIVEVERVDEPSKRKPHDPEKELHSQKSYVRAMAKRLGWTIKEPQPDSDGNAEKPPGVEREP